MEREDSFDTEYKLAKKEADRETRLVWLIYRAIKEVMENGKVVSVYCTETNRAIRAVFFQIERDSPEIMEKLVWSKPYRNSNVIHIQTKEGYSSGQG